MKKIGIIALFLSIIITGCGANKTANDTTVTVESTSADLPYSAYKDKDGNFDFKGETLRVMWDPLENDPPSLAKIKKFEEECNAKVEIVAGGWGDLQSRLSSSIASGTPADVVFNYSTFYPDFIIAGFLEPIDPYIPLIQSLARDDDENRFVLEETEYFQWEGDRYVFTNTDAPTHSLLFYNTGMLDELGLEYPWELEKQGKWTHEKFLEYTKILTLDKDGDGIIDQYGMNQELFLLTMLLTSNDTDTLQLGREAGETTKLSLQNPATLHSLTLYDQMVRDGSLGGDVTLGTAAMGFRGVWEVDNLNTNLGADGWGFAGAPRGPQNKTGVGAGIASRGYSLIKGSKNPVMATVFIHYLLNVASDIITEDDSPFEGFKSQEDYDRYIGYMQNLRKEDNHVLNHYYNFISALGTKPLATLLKEQEPLFQAALDSVLSAAGIVMSGAGSPFNTVQYKFETDINPLVFNLANTTNAIVTQTLDTGGAVQIKTDTIPVWDLYATTNPEILKFEPGHRYKVSFDYTLNKEVGEEGKYYLSFIANDKTLSDSQYGFKSPVGEKERYEVEFDFYDNVQDGYLRFGGFNTSDILIENLTVETVK